MLVDICDPEVMFIYLAQSLKWVQTPIAWPGVEPLCADCAVGWEYSLQADEVEDAVDSVEELLEEL